MNSTALYLGALHASFLSEHNHFLISKNYLIVESSEFRESTVSNCDDGILYFDSLSSPCSSPLWPALDSTNISPSTIKDILDDSMLPLLWERCALGFRIKYPNGISRYNKQLNILLCAFKWLSLHKINTFVFSYEPHNLWIYLLKKAALALNCNVLTLSSSPLPWRYFLLSQKSLEDPISVLPPPNPTVNTTLPISQFINEKLGIYNTAKPFYEKQTYLRSLKMRSPIHLQLLQRFLEKKYKNEIKSLSTARSTIFQHRYVAFFLSYQPECTTLPEGGLFVTVEPCIRLLSSLCASYNLLLVIREHPSTFRWGISVKWRPPDFYRQILSISNNIVIDHFNEDPFDLIDNSAAVASVSGSVLLEAGLRDKPILSLGTDQLKNFTHPHYSSLKNNLSFPSQVKKLFSSTTDNSPQSISESLSGYLLNIYNTTFGSDSYIGNNLMSAKLLGAYKSAAVLEVLKHLHSLPDASTNHN